MLPAIKLIGVTGYAGTGKDTVAEILVNQYGYQRCAFADKLRALAAEINPLIAIKAIVFDDKGDLISFIRYNDLLQRFGYEHAKREFPEVRAFLVALGHGARNVLGSDIWLDALLPPSQHGYGVQNLVLSDVRYANEAQRIRQLGGMVIKLIRPGYVAASAAEVSVDQINADYTITNDGTVEQLRETVKHIISHYHDDAQLT